MLTLKNFNKTGWTPGANTIAYRPLETDTNDTSGNGHNLSNGTQPLFDTSGDLHYAYSTGSSRPYSDGFAMATDKFTISFYVMITNLSQTGRWILNFRWDGTGDREMGGLYGTNYNPNLCFYPAHITSPDQFIGANPTVNTWYHYCLSYDRTASTPFCIAYVNGNSVGTATPATMSGTNVVISLFGSANNNNNCTMAYSKFIVENKGWTSQEVQDYFNMTKGDYGIS